MAAKKKTILSPVDAEIARLDTIFQDIPEEKRKIAEGLIAQAARLRILLDRAWEDIQANGDTEMFSQSANAEPYERERPVARLFNTRDKNYQTTIKMLIDMLPEGAEVDPANDILKFALTGAKK